MVAARTGRDATPEGTDEDFPICRCAAGCRDGVMRQWASPPPYPVGAVPYVPPLWRESRFGLEAAQLLRSPVWRGLGVPPGDGPACCSCPGSWPATARSATMTKWLRAHGYRTRRAGIRANVGCSEEACAAARGAPGGARRRTGERVAIIGQSRGGVLARAVAARRPDLVSGIVTLGAPTRVDAPRPPARAAPGRRARCARHRPRPRPLLPALPARACCAAFRDATSPARFRPTSYVAVYSRTDGIVDWRACLDPAADKLVEIRASHCGMAVNEGVHRAWRGAGALAAARRRRAAARRPQAAIWPSAEAVEADRRPAMLLSRRCVAVPGGEHRQVAVAHDAARRDASRSARRGRGGGRSTQSRRRRPRRRRRSRCRPERATRCRRRAARAAGRPGRPRRTRPARRAAGRAVPRPCRDPWALG